MSIPNPLPNVSMDPITAQQLAYVLFGNPINPQDKGIIGALQDEMRQIMLWSRLCFFAFLAALLTAFADLLAHIIK